MKIFLISGVCLILSLSVWGASPSSLTFVGRDGTETSLSAEGLEISYGEGVLTARNGVICKTFEVSALSRMFFSDSPQGVDSAGIGAETVSEVYTAGGLRIGEFKSEETMMEALEPGIYIVRTGKNVQKIVISNERNK